jgi:hypothetical protein
MPAAPPASSTYLHRLSFRPEHVEGSMIYSSDYVAADLTDACLRRMDGEQAPCQSEMHLAAM